MILYEDTRQQFNKHLNVHEYCKVHGIKIIRQSLNIGDYMIAGPGGGGITVDTKSGVAELAMDIHQDHKRFRRELERAKECGVQLIVLVEEELPGGRLDNWRSPVGKDGLPRHKFDPARLRKAMYTMQEKYGVKFRFCRPEETGVQIIEYLLGKRL